MYIIISMYINYFSSCVYGGEIGAHCSLKSHLHILTIILSNAIILENKGQRYLAQLKASTSNTEKLQFDKSISITGSVCLKSQTEVESCATAPVIKSPRAQNTFCLDNPGNSDSSAQVPHFQITQCTRNPNYERAKSENVSQVAK